MDFNIIDIIIGIFIIFSAYRGFNKGLIYQLSSLLGLIIGIYGAIHFSNYVSKYLSNSNIIDQQYVKIVSLAVTFIGIIVIIHFIGKTIESIFSFTGLGTLNKLGGVLFSITKQILILSIIIMIITFVNNNIEIINKSYFKNSIFIKNIINPIIELIKELTKNLIKN